MAIDAATLRIRYPALASATDEQIDYWLTDAALTVDETWGGDQERATLALAAHGIAKSGAVTSGIAAGLPAGVTSFKSAQFDVSISAEVANASASSDYRSTPYGQEYLRYLARHRGGPRLVGYVGC